MPSLRDGSSLAADADRLWIGQQFDEALERYESRLAGMKQYGAATGEGEAAAAELSEKIAGLRELKEIRRELKPMAKPEGVPDYHADVNREEVAEFESVIQREKDLPMEAKTVRLEPVAGNRKHASLTDPYWVRVKKDGKWVTVGLFKRTARAGLDLEAEEVYAKFAWKFHDQLGVEVPACTRARMTVETRVLEKDGSVTMLKAEPQEGLFVRWAPGTDLEKFGYYAPALFKRQMALDRVVAALFFDYDRKAGNFMVMELEKLLSLDHGQAFFRGFSGEALESDETVALFMAKMVAHWRNRTDVPTVGVYRILDEQITIEDMGKSITFIEDLFQVGEESMNGVKRVRMISDGPEQVMKLLRESRVPDPEEVMRILTARARVMRKVLTESFGTLRDLKPIPVEATPRTVHAEPPGQRGILRLRARATEELPLAA